MNSTVRHSFFTITLLTLAAAASATQGVSPGAADRIAAIDQRCPTFSWEAADRASWYELLAYALPEDVDNELAMTMDLGKDAEVLYKAVPGGATSWTPSAEQCLVPGGRYVWFVRALFGEAEFGEWSNGRYFEIPIAPTLDEVAQALDLLQRYVDTGGELSRVAEDSSRQTVHQPSRDHSRSASPKSVPTASAAIRGEHPDATGETYGVLGVSESPDGAGLAAVNTGGGADLVLDGSEDGAADTRFSEWGIDRPSSAQETFEITNSGSGRLHLEVEGNLTADVVRTEEVVVNGMTVIDDGGDWLGNGSTIPCASCVTSSDIANQTITTADLADDAVSERKLEDEAVTESKILGNSVTSAKIVDGQVRTADLGLNSVTSAKIADGTITAADIDPSAALDADTLDGQHGTFYRNASNISGGTLSTNRFSARSDLEAEGYLGNASGDIAQNNGTRQTNLNADQLDGMEGSSFQKEIVIEWVDTGYDEIYVDSCTTLTEISVTAPGNGTLLLDAFATAGFEHTLGTDDYLKISFEETEDHCPFSVSRQQIVSLPADLPTRTSWPEYTFPIAVNFDTWVASGTHTYYLNAKMVYGGAFETDYLTHINVRAMFFPD